MSTISASPVEQAPAMRTAGPASQPAAPARERPPAPAARGDRSVIGAAEPPADPGAGQLAAGLQSNFAAPPAQSLEIDLPRHTQARLSHTAARINDPATTPAQRRELLREQAQLRTQQYDTQHRPAQQTRRDLPSGSQVLGQGLDRVRSVTGDFGPVGSAQRLREAVARPDLTAAQRGSAIGGEVAGVAGGKVAAGVAMARGAAVGGRLGLSAGVAAGMVVGGPPGAFAGGVVGAGGGTVVGGAAGWLLGNAAGDAAARPVGAGVGEMVGDRLAR